MRWMFRVFVLIATLLLLARPAVAQRAQLPWTKRSAEATVGHYWIKTDLPADEANELARHLNLMYREYARRLASLPPRAQEELNVLIFASRREYELTLQSQYGVNATNTGGIFFATPELKALAFWTEGLSKRRIYHVLQHEGFHQFAWSRFGNDLPQWVNEGLAEFFGEAVLLGNRLVIGQSTPRVITQVQDAIENKETVPFHRMLTMSGQEWGQRVREGRGRLQYHQAWSMVHFLVFGDGGRYVEAFERYLKLLNAGVLSDLAFVRAFRSNNRITEFNREDIADFESAWKKAALRASPSALVTALERIEFLAEGMLELHYKDVRPASMEELKAALEDTGFTHTLTLHGLSTTLVAGDNTNYTIPKDELTDKQPTFILRKPDLRFIPAIERVLERDNPTPMLIATEGLAPENIVVKWIRDRETNTFRYEISIEKKRRR